MKTGIYQIRNLVNGKCYIGSVAGQYGFRSRWSKHKSDLFGGQHHSVHLQRAWNKYGSNAFVFEILEKCEPAKCIEREVRIIKRALRWGIANNKIAQRFNVASCTISNIKAGRKWRHIDG